MEGEDTLADVYLTVDVANLALAARSDVLRPTRSPLLERAIPPSLRDLRNRWFALALRVRSTSTTPKR